MPEMNPMLTKNGSNLAKIITIPPVKEVAEFFREDTFIKDRWTKEYNAMAMLKVGLLIAAEIEVQGYAI